MKDFSNLASINIKYLANMFAFALLSDPKDVPWSRTASDILSIDTPQQEEPEKQYQPIIVENLRFILMQGNGLHGNLIDVESTEGSKGEILHLLIECAHILYGLNVCNESDLQHQAKITQLCYFATRLFGGKVANISGEILSINIDASIPRDQQSAWQPFLLETHSDAAQTTSTLNSKHAHQASKIKAMVTSYKDSEGVLRPHLGIFNLLAELATA